MAAALCGAGLTVAAAPAHAQLFDQFVPEEIYGRGVEPAVTVASRQRTEYDTGGVRIGNVTVRPLLTESVGYETNVLATGNNRTRGATLIETNASLDARADTSRGSVVAGLTLDDNRYPDLNAQTFTNWNVRLGGAYSLGRDSVSLYVSHENQNQTPRDLGVPQLTAPLAVSIDRAQLGYQALLNRLTLTPSLQVGRFRYNSGFVSGSIYDQSFRNRIVVTPAVTAAYELASRRSVVLVVRDTAASYSRSTVLNPRRDYNDVELLGGFDYDVNGIVRVRLLAGYEQRTFSSSTYATISAPVAELTLIYNPTGLTTVTGVLARRIQDSANEATAAATSLSATLRVDHELRRNVVLGATAAVTQNDYGTTGDSQLQLEGILTASYLFNRHVAASATYDVLTRTNGGNTTNSNFNSLTFNGFTTGSNFIDHKFLLQLRLAL